MCRIGKAAGGGSGVPTLTAIKIGLQMISLRNLHCLPLSVPLDYFASTVPWIMQRRGEFDLFVHPNTGCEVVDHTVWPVVGGTKWCDLCSRRVRVYLSPCLFAYLSVCLSVLSVHVRLSLSVSRSVCLPVCLSVCLFVCLSVRPSVCPSVCSRVIVSLSVCPRVSAYVCLPASFVACWN